MDRRIPLMMTRSPGRYLAGEVVGHIDIERLRLFAAPEALGGFLDPEFLGVDEPWTVRGSGPVS